MASDVTGRNRRYLCVAFVAAPAPDGTLVPLEIAVASPGGGLHSRMVAPSPSWPRVVRAPGLGPLLDAAAVEGVPAADLARWARDNLSGRTLLSDAAHVDQAVLDRLMSAAAPYRRLSLDPYFATVDRLREGNDAIDAALLNAWISEIEGPCARPVGAADRARSRSELLGRVLGMIEGAVPA